MGDDSYDVFLSHNSQDKPAVRALADALVARGVTPWLDERELVPGQPWQEALEEIIEAVPAAMVLVGSDGFGPWHDREMRASLSEFVDRKASVIPVLLPGAPKKPKLPLFLRAFMWVDLRKGLTEEDLEKLVWGITGEKPQSATPAISPSAIPTSTHRLPKTGGNFVGREKELARLDEAWADPSMHVISLVAAGGVGKSALVNSWVAAMSKDGWRGAERVFAWSFYSQGTKETTATSADTFVDEALRWFGDPDPAAGSPWQKGERLAALVQQSKTLLLLDGMEPLQTKPGPNGGQVQDPALATLLRELAGSNQGLCVVTTRLAVADLDDWADTAPKVDLNTLGPRAGAALLVGLGVEDPQKELEQASKDFGGHGLALTLLGTYLRDVLDGDVRRRSEVDLLEQDEEEGGKAGKMMGSYERWLGVGPELAVLRLLSLFDRPAEEPAIAALRKAPAIKGLTEPIQADKAWKRALARLRKARLLAEPDGSDALDTHPLVRTWFEGRLKEILPEAFREAHDRLYEHYKATADPMPDDLEGLQPLYAAVHHGCKAGRHQKTFDEVYSRRIGRGYAFSVKQLGAFGADLAAVASFFAEHWTQPAEGLAESTRDLLLNLAGFRLRALGRLSESVAPFATALEHYVARTVWDESALNAGNLSQVCLTLGRLNEGRGYGELALKYGNQSRDEQRKTISRATLADILHQMGERQESSALFAEAEHFQASSRPHEPRLHSLRGFQYCDFLLPASHLLVSRPRLLQRGNTEATKEELGEVIDRAKAALVIESRHGWLHAIALDHLILGRAHHELAIVAKTDSASESAGLEARKHLDESVDGLRAAGTRDLLPRGLLARAAFHRWRKDLEGCQKDLDEARRVAERSGMRLYLCDCYLEAARLHYARDELDEARRELEIAKKEIDAMGYHRRDPEVEDLEAVLEV